MSDMDEGLGPDFITVTDEEGNDFELEHLATLEYQDNTYMAFVPADMDENDKDYGIIILRVFEENGESMLADIDDEAELNAVYEQFSDMLFEEEDGEDTAQ